MSTLFKSPPGTFVKYQDVEFPQARAFAVNTRVGRQKREVSSVLLRDDHIVLLAIDGLLALNAAFKKWRQHRRTLRALAGLDERQLRDIGLTREQTYYHALAGLYETQSERINSKPLGGRK